MDVLTEISPLKEEDCLYIVERHKRVFDYPLHRHEVYELTFVSNGKGLKRIVGDSIEDVKDIDLALIGPNISHCWLQGVADNVSEKHEIVFQFKWNAKWFDFRQMKPVHDLLKHSSVGLSFGTETTIIAYSMLRQMIDAKDEYTCFIKSLELLNHLAQAKDVRELSSETFAQAGITEKSRRIAKVKQWISQNYSNEISLSDLADMVCMEPTSFSRFFKKQTGQRISDYIIEERVANASRLLIQSTRSISDIAYDCGFNNLANFNRLFKKHRGCTPKTFRSDYLKSRIII